MTRKNPTVRASLIASFALVASLLAGGPALAIEEPAFTLEAKREKIEIRRYSPMIAAEVTMSGERWRAANDGFSPLANYIFGGNQPKSKIAMTAPVSQTRKAGQKIAMTAPVSQTEANGEWIVRFIMPQQYKMEDLPTPNDPSVRLIEVPAQRMAAIRFSGSAGDKIVAQKEAELLAALAEMGETPAGPATYAYYNPPWIPPPLRRNEVLLPLKDKGS